MRLLRVTLRNFRGVIDTTVHFGDGATVIVGPNEVGKSSIAEAIRLVRDMKASSQHRFIRSLEPVDRDAGPEVELELRTGAYELTYRKRWLKAPQTELTITAPAPEQVTGDQAHDRFLAILDETVDLDLLTALDVAQGASLDQPELADISSLQRALDETSDDPAGHDTLLERIQQEYDYYFTPRTAKPTGDYRKAQEELEQLEEQVSKLQEESGELDRLTEQHASQSELLAELDTRAEQARGELREARERANELERLREAVTTSQQALEEAQRARDTAVEQQQSRADLVAQLTSREQEIAGKEQHLAEMADARELAEQLRDEAVRNVTGHQDRVDSLRTQAREAKAAREQKRNRADHDELAERLRRVREADESRRRTEAELETLTVDDAVLERLSALETEVQVAKRERGATAATVHVQPLGSQPVTIDGEVVADDHHESTVHDPVDVQVEGVVSVEIRPGTTPTDLDSRVEQAQQDLETELRAVDVSSVDEARTIATRRNEAVSELEQAKSALNSVLGDTALEDLEQQLANLSARLEQTADGEPEGELAELEAAEQRAAEVEQEADEALRAAQADTAKRREDFDTAHEKWVRATESLDAARSEHDRLAQRLQEDRRAQGDEALDAAVETAQRDLTEKQQEAERARAAVEAADPDTRDMELQNAQDLVERCDREREETKAEVSRLGTLIDDRAKDSIYDRLANAKAQRDATWTSCQRLERAAQAVKLLRSIMDRKHVEAQQKYVAPFKHEIERLGKPVFGQDFSVQVSAQLEIESRTMGGATVPFDALSAGTKEQVALLGRLACAQLIDPAEGAPVVLDDTLGFADPDRLKALNVVLNTVGDATQVVLLTCHPQRFASLGDAHEVRLQAQQQ